MAEVEGAAAGGRGGLSTGPGWGPRSKVKTLTTPSSHLSGIAGIFRRRDRRRLKMYLGETI